MGADAAFESHLSCLWCSYWRGGLDLQGSWLGEDRILPGKLGAISALSGVKTGVCEDNGKSDPGGRQAPRSVRIVKGDLQVWGARPETLCPLAAQWNRWAAQQARHRLAELRAKEAMLMSFKIRMKMFIAESRTCVSAESCGKGAAFSQPFGFIFARWLFICWWCC